MNAKRRILPEPLTEKWNHWEFHAVIELLRGDTGQPLVFAVERKIQIHASKPEDFIPITQTNKLEIDLEKDCAPTARREAVVDGLAWDLFDRLSGYIPGMASWEPHIHEDVWDQRMQIIANGDRCTVNAKFPGYQLVAAEDVDKFKREMDEHLLYQLCVHVIDAILDPPTPIERTSPSW